MNILRIAALLAALGVGACASTSELTTPINDFATASTKASDALKAYDSAAAAAVTADRKAEALKKSGYVTYKQGSVDCSSHSKNCFVTVPIDDDNCPQTGCEIEVQTVIPKQVAAMSAVAAYAKGLQDIAKADVSGDVQSGLDKAAAGIKGIVGVIDPPAAAAVDIVSKPVVDTAMFVFKQYQEQVKLDAIRAATQTMDPYLSCDATHKEDCAAHLFGTTADFLDAANKADLARGFQKSWNKWDQAKAVDESLLNDVLASAKLLNTALAAKPSELFDQLAVAHRKLTDALRPEKMSLSDALAEIGKFLALAQQIQALADEFNTAATKLNGTQK